MNDEHPVLARLDRVRKSYGAVEALDGVDLKVRGGQMLALLGPNGAGKSTAIGLLLGQDTVDAGAVSLFGAPPHAMAVRRRVGLMLQSAGIPDTLKVSELLDLTRSYYADPRSLADCVALAGLDGLLCKDQWNIVYLSGYFHSQTERPEALWIPATGDPALFAPGLDRDLVSTWWIRDAEYYFDYPHAQANNDPRTATVAGPSGTVDLWKWMAQGLGRRGFAAKKIGLDWDAPDSSLRKLKEVLPQATFRAASIARSNQVPAMSTSPSRWQQRASSINTCTSARRSPTSRCCCSESCSNAAISTSRPCRSR